MATCVQEALGYLGFPAVPSQYLLFDRALCLAKECCLARPAARDHDDILYAARLYGSIAEISIKVTGWLFVQRDKVIYSFL